MAWTVVVCLAIALIVVGSRYYWVIERLKQKKKAIDNLYAQIESMSSAHGLDKMRVIELEDAIEKGFGVKVRREVTEVITDFTKLEWVVILSGVDKLIQLAKFPDDVRIYLQILDKIQAFIDHLKEEAEGPHEV